MDVETQTRNIEYMEKTLQIIQHLRNLRGTLRSRGLGLSASFFFNLYFKIICIIILNFELNF